MTNNFEERLRVVETKCEITALFQDEVKRKLSEISAKLDKLMEGKAHHDTIQSELNRRIEKLETNQRWFVIAIIGWIMSLFIHIFGKYL